MMHSQIATSAAHIARALPRDDEQRTGLLRSGLRHSSLAESSGDRSLDHDGYAIELALRLHEITGENSLSQVTSALARVREAESATAQGLAGDVEFARASAALSDRDTPRALSHLFTAVDHYDRAMTLPRDDRSADIGYHLAKRGRCHALLYEVGGDAIGRRDTTQLDCALIDWLDPRTQPHRPDHEPARLLLARARLAAARSDTVAAEADIATAAHLLAEQDQLRIEQRLQGQALGVAIESALDAGNLEAAIEAALSVVKLPLDAPAPAGSMAKAARWLHGRLPIDEWERIAEPILNRIEVDAAHPALTGSARSHVTGHAASLARLLSLNAEATSLLRAVELSRTHINSAHTISAAALDGASRSAFEYGQAHIGTREAPSEDDLGIWIDALLWGASALRTEQTIRTTVDSRFDIEACAMRIAGAASILLDATGDISYADTAADSLEIAANLGPSMRIDAARARLDIAREALASNATKPPASPMARQQTPVADSAQHNRKRSHTAWRTLADADRLAGEAARELRQQAARQFCELASADDLILGGKARGGRRGVSSVSDPYGIAQQLVVLKRVDLDTARREFEAITGLSAWIASADKPRGWTVPDPVGVVEVNAEDAVLVMRRLPGHTLAHHVMEHLDDRAPNPQRMFDIAVDALGDFHSALWHTSGHPEDMSASFRRAARQITAHDDAERATHEIRSLLEGTPQVTKKDAHAGNWIWSTASGGLIVIDVEGSTTRPVLIELATLIDDLPLIGLTSEGWEERLDIAHRYISLLPPQARPAARETRQRLEAGALTVAVIGLARLRRRTWGTSSRGIRFARYQHTHYKRLCAYLAANASSARVRSAAAAFAGRAKETLS